MKAFAVRPLEPDSARVIERAPPAPAPGQVPVRVLEVGICGTDAEINAGLYGQAPSREHLLVLGHEILGELEDGRLVVPMVRRPCPNCANCGAGSQDMCSSGEYTELGIKGAHGGLCESIAEDPRWLIPVDSGARSYAVLAEPMSVFAKGLAQARRIQGRLRWEPRRALVLGAGPIGLLATLSLRTQGWDVTTMARRPESGLKGEIVRGSGARYISTGRTPVAALPAGNFDFIFEATGSAQAAFDSFPALAINGALCLTSVTGGDARASLPIDRLNFDLVLGNRVVFGTVNAHREDYLKGLVYLDEIEKSFPGFLARLFTGRVGFAQDPKEIFAIQREGIKTIFEIGA